MDSTDRMKSSARRPLHMVLALACATATLGGCATDLSALSRTGALAKSTKAQQAATAGVLISGSVMAPAGVIAVGGGNLGGKGYAVLQSLEEKPLANAEVFLADAAGSPIPGLDPVKTDAKGKFSFQDVPKGFTFVVVARGQNQDGKEALLQTLAKSGELGASAEVNAATTLLTSSVVESQGGSLGDFNPANFKSAVETAKKNLKAEDMPDFSDRAAVAARMKAIAERVGELKSQIDAIKTELKDIKKSLDELKTQIANRKPIVGDRPQGVPFDCEEGFKKADRNGDGKIDREEAQAAFPEPNGNFDEAFKRRDRNADGAIDPSEFCQPPVGQPPMPPQPVNCDEAVKKADRNADGKIDREEARAAFPNATNFDEEFKRRDRDGDGALSPQEFCGGQPVPPQPQPPVNGCEDGFKKADRNADGKVDREEARAAFPNDPNFDQNFPRRDRSGDGVLDPKEFCTPPEAPAPQPTQPPQDTTTVNQPTTNPPVANQPGTTQPPAGECTAPIAHAIGLSPALASAIGFPAKIRVVVPNVNQIKGEGRFETAEGQVKLEINEGCPHDYILANAEGKEVKRVRFTIPKGAPAEIKLPL